MSEFEMNRHQSRMAAFQILYQRNFYQKLQAIIQTQIDQINDMPYLDSVANNLTVSTAPKVYKQLKQVIASHQPNSHYLRQFGFQTKIIRHANMVEFRQLNEAKTFILTLKRGEDFSKIAQQLKESDVSTISPIRRISVQTGPLADENKSTLLQLKDGEYTQQPIKITGKYGDKYVVAQMANDTYDLVQIVVKKRQNELTALNQLDFSNEITVGNIIGFVTSELTVDLSNYAHELVDLVIEKEAILIQQIRALLANKWTIDRISPVSLIILQLALVEIQHHAIPNEIVASEAIELADDFTDEQDKKFINGVVAKMILK